MANRRMFSRRIINSARFIKLTKDAQALYLHLCMNADDDGAVEAYPVRKALGVEEDALANLAGRGFIIMLDQENEVVYITDWLEHNKIRADRIQTSMYRDLIANVIGAQVLIEPKKRSDLKSSNVIDVSAGTELAGRSMDGPRTDNGRTMDRLGEDRLSKDKIGEVKKGDDKTEKDKKAEKKPKKHKYGEYGHVLLTDDEYERLEERTGGNRDYYIKEVDSYVDRTGKPYVRYFSAIANFYDRDLKNGRVPKKQTPSGVMEHTKEENKLAFASPITFD